MHDRERDITFIQQFYNHLDTTQPNIPVISLSLLM